MLACLALLIGSKGQTPIISGGLEPKMGARLANFGPERMPSEARKVSDSSGDLRLEATWAELGIMLAYLTWLLGSRS